MITTPLDMYAKMAQHRRIGSTLFNIMGVNYDRPAVFVFANRVSAQSALDDSVKYLESQGVKLPANLINRANMTLGPVHFSTVNQVFDPVRGAYEYGQMPISVDHFALVTMIQEDQRLKEQWTRDSERNRIFTVARKVHKEFDAKAVVKLRKQWDDAAEEHAQQKMLEDLSDKPKPDWKF